MKKRLFMFGCSLTQYMWPTWATLLNFTDFDEVQNWGYPGIGNRAIAERISECNIKHKFTKSDTVIVQWSTHLRNDFFHQEGLLVDRHPGWKTGGSIFNFKNRKIYNNEWYFSFFDEEAYIYHSLNYIHLSQQLLKNLNVNWYMTSIGDLRNLSSDFQHPAEYGENSIFLNIKNIFKSKEFPLFKKTPTLKIYEDEIWTSNQHRWLSPILSYLQNTVKEKDDLYYDFYDQEYQQIATDFHPIPRAHYKWINEILRPKVDFEINEEKCINLCEKIDEIYGEHHIVPREVFEIKLFKTNFENISWPEPLLGFVNFEDNK
jgi:hypothetical protein